jgi:hypothetical protein
MPQQMVNVTYFFRSCFAVSVDKTLLLFSYTRVDEQDREAWISPADMAGFRHIIVFIPAPSVEHMDTEAFLWPSYLPVDFVAAPSLKNFIPEKENVHFLSPGQSITLLDTEITAYPSVDDGVAFNAKVNDLNIYHAGELNLWHWRDENDARTVMEIEEEFNKLLDYQPSGVDLAMFTVDPRQGGFYDEGVNRFMRRKLPKVLIPMHFGMNGEVINNFLREHAGIQTLVLPIFTVRGALVLDYSHVPPYYYVPKMPDQGEERQLLSAYLGDNPFASTDMPIKLD